MIARGAPALVAVLLGCGRAAPPPADLLLVGGRVYTVETERPWAGAVAVRGDRIARVGTEAEVRALQGPATRILDLEGGLVLPGFIDGHTHFLDGSLMLEQLDLAGAETLVSMQERLRAYAAARPEEPWILGFGWPYSAFPGGAPHRRDLDAVESRRPVFLYSYDGHSAWANSAALAAAGIAAEGRPQPPGQGEVVLDPKTGEPTGCLREAAMGLVERVLPKPSRDRKLAALEQGLRHAASLGITSIQNCGSVPYSSPEFGEEELDLYDELERRGSLTLRTSTAFPMPDQADQLTDSLVARIVAAKARHQGSLVRTGAVKFLVDGVIESRTAAMLAPYANHPSFRGTPRYKPRHLGEMVRKVDAAGLQIYIHAIGDAAVRMSLDALESAVRANPSHPRRHRLEHIETIDAVDIPRFASLGVLASMQPRHAYPDANLLTVWAANLGPERVRRAFAWNDLSQAGALLVFGSDWPVVSLDPIPGLRNAVLRQDTEGAPPGGWVPSQRLSLEQAIAAYTLHGAFASFEEEVKGSIREGKLADLVVLRPDPFRIAPQEIHRAKVVLTLLGGREVYRRPPD
jgi:predicted amidohydrolase YtcJ